MAGCCGCRWLGGSLVLVTSRRHPSALDATAISLDTLPPAEGEDILRQALEMFRRIGAVEIAELSAELHALGDARPTPHQ